MSLNVLENNSHSKGPNFISHGSAFKKSDLPTTIVAIRLSFGNPCEINNSINPLINSDINTGKITPCASILTLLSSLPRETSTVPICIFCSSVKPKSPLVYKRYVFNAIILLYKSFKSGFRRSTSDI